MHQAQWSPERPLPPPVSLASQSHHEKPPEVTCTSRGRPGFPASTRESPRETFFNTSRGQIPLPWLGSNDALPLATRMETRLPWRPTRGSLTSPSYLVRNRKGTVSIENLWMFIKSMSLSADNQRWLADRLIESSNEKTSSVHPYTIEELNRRIDKAEQSIANGRVISHTEVMNRMNEFIQKHS